MGGSAECGPSANNPLRSLTKTFDRDHSAQQVRATSPYPIPYCRRPYYFIQDLPSLNRAGPSSQVGYPWHSVWVVQLTTGYPVSRLSERILTPFRARTSKRPLISSRLRILPHCYILLCRHSSFPASGMRSQVSITRVPSFLCSSQRCCRKRPNLIHPVLPGHLTS